jgi:DNA repair exonuclease SbcCD ATPase subunit
MTQPNPSYTQIRTEYLAELEEAQTELGRVKLELSTVVSRKHKEVTATKVARMANRFHERCQKLGKGLAKYRAQHLLDKSYIQRQKRELRRLNALVPPSERALVSEVKLEDACPLCGCSFPATDHEQLKRNLKAIVIQRDEVVVKLKDVTGELRRVKAGK